MKRFLVMSVALLTIGVASAESGKVIMKALKSSHNYTAIEVISPIKVVVEERTGGNIIVRATESMMPHIVIDVEGKTLKISTDFKQLKRKDNTVIAEVYLPYNGKLSSFEISAFSSLDIKPVLNTEKLDIECVGVSQITLKAKANKANIEVAGGSSVESDIDCTSLDAEVAGAATLTLNGSATKAEIDVAGAATLNADEFNCSQLKAEVVGASKATLKADMCTLDVVGASSATVDCSTQLTASAVGASSIKYTGDCRVNIIENIGASSIKKR